MEEAIELANPVEADTSTVQNAATRLASLMEGTPSEEVTETPEDTTHPEPEVAEVEVEAAAEGPTEESTEDPVTHFTDLAEHLGVEQSYLETLLVPTKVNGEEREASIKDLLSSFQKGESADLKLMELSDERKQFNAELSQTKEQLSQEWGRIQALNTELQSMLTGDEDEEISNLRHTDPAEYAARMAERQLRYQRASKVQEEMRQANAEKTLTEYGHRVQSERTKLVESIPGWADDKVRESETMKVRSYLKAQGFQDFEIDGKITDGQLVHPGMIDHRFIEAFQKAMLYDEAKKGTEPKKAKLKTLPKVGAGKPKSKSDVSESKMKEVRGRVRQSGKLDDAAAAIAQLMG